MNDDMQKRCELFVQNRDIIKSVFPWDSAFMHPVCAGIYTAKGLLTDASRLKFCLELLKQKTGPLSPFRGLSRLAVSSLLAVSPDPETRLTCILDLHGQLKASSLPSSDHLAVAAAITVDLTGPEKYASVAERTQALYRAMKEDHPFLTSYEDSAFAAILALSPAENGHLIEETKKCYTLLKPYFTYGNSVQSLSHILALGAASAEQKCSRTMELFAYLKRLGFKYGRTFELPTLGVLALTEADIDILAQEMIEADGFLKTQKGFGSLSAGTAQRLMYAGMLTLYGYMPEEKTIQVAALSSAVSLAVANQAAICATIAATTVIT